MVMLVQGDVDCLAERALDTMNFDVLRGRPMRIMWFQRDPPSVVLAWETFFIKNLDKSMVQNPRFTNLYIKNFGDDLGDDELGELFSAHGKVLSVVVMKDKPWLWLCQL